MKIGIDLDGVLVDSIGYWVRVLNREGGAAYTSGDLPYTNPDPKLYQCELDHELEMMIAPRPMDQAVPTLARLREQGHELMVITARPERLFWLTEAWLKYHGIQVNGLIFVGERSKGQVALDAGIDLMLEDSPRHVESLVAAGVPVMLFDAPYNHSMAAHRLVTRCRGWGEVERQVWRGGEAG